MIQAIIIDDELHCIETLEEKIKMYCPNIEVVNKFTKPKEALKFLDEHSPDLVFLDIEMPIYNGFSLLEQLSKIDFHIVFTTAYDQYALKAIKFSAFDYLLKPIDKDDLLSLSERMSIKRRISTVDEQFKILMQQINNTNSTQTKISIPTSDGMLFVRLLDILRVESDNNYSTVFFTDRKPLLVSKTLKEFEELLTPHQFFRIHNSHLINTKLISKYVRTDGGYIIMDNGDKIEISRRRKEEFMEYLSSQD
jgi:two-component system, LytTR family, response regulator